MSDVGPAAPCARCTNTRAIKGRGLCEPCYVHNWKSGTLADFERTSRTRDELLDDWEILRRQGFSMAHAADRLGITRKGLERAIDRARRDGDPRAKRRPDAWAS